ncbi:orotidine-5'-phosphate decarboxylase [Legionella impletisoli]|uniref:Orotidine 5'-phosphate decarboxylase n=1 Tax=Legionella impletisoli TaxID=343510 RepID=A0A917NAF7_9GAMM|nr:orotidine-5'-phosphate decarboxylase [Legionella impletisoli]GGI77829.1 orotidine 5'-phosphate decarboxylase [Legionella impletisoli]
MTPKLIIALDYNSDINALSFVEQLDPALTALKIGSELYTYYGPRFVKKIIAKGFKVFLDLKFHDIPNTVAAACKASADLGVWMLNVHAAGGFKMMHAAKRALDEYGSERPILIAVTVLTSMSEPELKDIGIVTSLQQHVVKLAKLAKSAELDGVVSSAHEVKAVKEACGLDFLTITPGIRLPSSGQDDQTRIVTPEAAVQAGSDFLVVGRPITKAENPNLVINQIISMQGS